MAVSGWYQSVSVPTDIRYYNSTENLLRSLGTNTNRYANNTDLSNPYQWKPYELGIAGTVYDMCIRYQIGNCVMVLYQGDWVHGVIREWNEEYNSYTVHAYRFTEPSLHAYTNAVVTQNRRSQIRSMDRADRDEFFRLLWLCTVNIRPEADRGPFYADTPTIAELRRIIQADAP